MGERMTPAVLGKPKVPPMYPARRSSSGAMRLGGLTRRADGDLLRREDRRRGRYPAFCAPASAGQLESRPERLFSTGPARWDGPSWVVVSQNDDR